MTPSRGRTELESLQGRARVFPADAEMEDAPFTVVEDDLVRPDVVVRADEPGNPNMLMDIPRSVALQFLHP